MPRSRRVLLALCAVSISALAGCGATGEAPPRPNGSGGTSGGSGGASVDAGGNDVRPSSDAPAGGSGGASVDAAPDNTAAMDMRADGTGPGLTPEEAMTQYFTTYCTKIIMCCPPAVIQAVGGDLSTCKDLVDPDRQRLSAAIREGALSGRVTYSGLGMGECVRKFMAAPCASLRAQGDPTGPIAECNNSIVAKVPLGMPCADDIECIDSWCDADQGSKCVAKLPPGAVCGRDEACASGDCSQNGSCNPPAPPGMPDDGLCG